MANFKDHFSAHAAEYAQHRPTYPDGLFAWIRSAAASDARVVWDCACGNGQASRGLARHFEQIIATDASAKQIAAAVATPNIDYRVTGAFDSGLDTDSVDVVTVAQALHWFAGDAFFNEARRALRPGGLLCVWAYGLQRISPEIDPAIDDFYWNTLDGYWPPERAHIDDLYQSLPFPSPELETPELAMRIDWTLGEFLSYVNTWSAVRRRESEMGRDPIAELRTALRDPWGNSDARRTVSWPLIVRAARL